jgi:hypothetical protein
LRTKIAKLILNRHPNTEILLDSYFFEGMVLIWKAAYTKGASGGAVVEALRYKPGRSLV